MLSASESKDRKMEIAAVIDFCSAKGMKISRTQIFNFFGVIQQTGSLWFPSSYVPNHRDGTQQEATTSSTLSRPTKTSPPVKRKNPVRNGGRDRKRLREMLEDMGDESPEASSPPPLSTPGLSRASGSPMPEEPPTPSKRKISQPRKSSATRAGPQVKQEEQVEIEAEIFGDECVV